MIYRGNMEYNRPVQTYDSAEDEYIDSEETLSMYWSAEQTELGDGRKEWDFQCSAVDEDGNEIELSDAEENSIFETLRQDGEF